MRVWKRIIFLQFFKQFQFWEHFLTKTKHLSGSNSKICQKSMMVTFLPVLFLLKQRQQQRVCDFRWLALLLKNYIPNLRESLFTFLPRENPRIFQEPRQSTTQFVMRLAWIKLTSLTYAARSIPIIVRS